MIRKHKGVPRFTVQFIYHGRGNRPVMNRLLLILCLSVAFVGSISSAMAQSWTPIPNSAAVTGAAVLPNGAIVGVGTDQQLWTRATLTSDWKQVPNSGAVTSVAVMADGAIVGVGTDRQLWTRATLTGDWKLVPNSGAVNSVAVMADGAILGVGTDQQLWIRATLTGDWKQVPDSGPVRSVAAMPDGSVLGVGVDNALQTRSKDSLIVANASSANPANTPSEPEPCTSCPPWVSRSLAGSYLPLAAQAGIWSNPKPFNRASGQMTVQSRFTRHKGTTCEFDVQFNNVGSKAVDEGVIVSHPGKAAVTGYDHVIRIRLKPGTSYAFGTEVRQCPLNWGETKDMAKCASCEPIVYFVAQ